MEKFHDMHDYPITILLARSSPALGAAVFERSEDGSVTNWSRKDSNENDLINIGAYIIDPTPEVLKLLRDLSHHKEDPFNTAAIKAQLMAAYVAEEVGFNVNTSSSYHHLLGYLER
jgi:NDP-sugar pyrophosphorylase family protein